MRLPRHFCKNSFNSTHALSSHIMKSIPCQCFLSGQVPPIPPLVFGHIHTPSVDPQASRRSSCHLSEQPGTTSFPDGLSQIIHHPSVHSPTPDDCFLSPHSIFQLPSEIIEKLKCLHLDFDDQEIQHNSDSYSLNLSTHPHDSSTFPLPGANAVLLPDEDFHPPPTGYTLGKVFPLLPTKILTCSKHFPVP